MKNKKKGKVIQILICFLVAVFIYILVAFISGYRDYTKVDLVKNNKPIFTMADLSVRNLMVGDLEDIAMTEFGTPKKIEKFKDKKDYYKSYYYDGLVLTFKKDNDSYILMKATVTSKDYIVSRNIKVGNLINDVMNEFLIDKENGKYLYGNYKEDSLTNKEVKDTIFYGKRDKKLVYYLYATGPYKKEYATWNDDIAQLTMEVSMGRVKKIEWMYGPVIDD